MNVFCQRILTRNIYITTTSRKGKLKTAIDALIPQVSTLRNWYLGAQSTYVNFFLTSVIFVTEPHRV